MVIPTKNGNSNQKMVIQSKSGPENAWHVPFELAALPLIIMCKRFVTFQHGA